MHGLMRTDSLGTTGLQVSALAIGAACFGDPLAERESIAVLRRAFEHGVNLVDTADAYGAGRSETIVGKAIAGRREHVLISTKVFGSMGMGPNDRGSSRKHIVEAAEASLRRLGVDRIDLYQLHQPDPDVEIDESLAAMDDLVRAGKIHHAGCSNFFPSQLVDAVWAGRRIRGMAASRTTAPSGLPATEQVPYSILDRRIETELVPYCVRNGIGLLPYTPLAQGILGGRYRGTTPPEDSRCSRSELWRQWFDRIPRPALDLAGELAQIADELGITLPQLAIAWVLRAGPVATTIVGVRTPEQVDELVAAIDIELDGAILERIDAIHPAGAFASF